LDSLKDYPEWQQKAREELNRLIAFGNMKEHFPKYYEILVKILYLLFRINKKFLNN
jgi:hypothetical protein